MGTRFKKVLEDLLVNLPRTILVIASIALGILGTGFILNSYTITDREMNSSYRNTTPASFTMCINSVDDALLTSLKANKDIAKLEPRRMIIARTGTKEDTWYQSQIYVVEDFENLKLNTFRTSTGASVPKSGEILLENTSLSVVHLGVGDTLNIKIPQNKASTITIAGSVQADGTNPAWMHNMVYGYISEETLNMLGTPATESEILFLVAGNIYDKSYIEGVAESTKKICEENGHTVSSIIIPTPGEHPNANQMKSILLLFQIFGFLSLLLSGVLVINIISSMLKGQIKQIAIMKSMGATNSQIAGMYYAFVIILGIVALAFAVPMASAMAKSMSDLLTKILVFTITDYSIPMWSYAVQIVVGILIPMIAATYPILKGCMIPVNDGLHDLGINKSKFGNSIIEHILRKINMGSNAFVLSIRNTFRKPGRLFFTIATLAIGGATLMTSLNMSASLKNTYKEAINNYNCDTQFTFSKNYSEDEIQKVLDTLPEIASAKYLSSTDASMSYENQTSIKYNASDVLTIANITHTHGSNLEETYRKTEKAFHEAGIDVLTSSTIEGVEEIYDKHLLTIAGLLTVAAILVIIVGMMGLISTAGINVMERMREIGIMRSFGAGSRDILHIMIYENLLTGIISWIFAFFLSIPLSLFMNDYFGKTFLSKPLVNTFSTTGLIIWFGLIIIINVFVSIITAQKAIKLPINKVLSYE